MRVPSGEPELVRAGAAGDPAALAALWDAYGARVFAFCQRVLGRADAAADAAQDAFLLAHAELGSLARTGESFGTAVFRAARTTSHDLLARDRAAGGARRGPAPTLSAAAARLRPQQRAAVALSGLERLRYAEIAAVLGIGTEAVGAVLARARLRLHDELHGSALAAAAVRCARLRGRDPAAGRGLRRRARRGRRRLGRPARRALPDVPAHAARHGRGGCHLRGLVAGASRPRGWAARRWPSSAPGPARAGGRGRGGRGRGRERRRRVDHAAAEGLRRAARRRPARRWRARQWP